MRRGVHHRVLYEQHSKPQHLPRHLNHLHSASSDGEIKALGLKIIGRGMMKPELLDTNTRLDVFLKDRNIATPVENPNQTVSEFIDSIVRWKILAKLRSILKVGVLCGIY